MKGKPARASHPLQSKVGTNYTAARTDKVPYFVRYPFPRTKNERSRVCWLDDANLRSYCRVRPPCMWPGLGWAGLKNATLPKELFDFHAHLQ